MKLFHCFGTSATEVEWGENQSYVQTKLHWLRCASPSQRPRALFWSWVGRSGHGRSLLVLSVACVFPRYFRWQAPRDCWLDCLLWEWRLAWSPRDPPRFPRYGLGDASSLLPSRFDCWTLTRNCLYRHRYFVYRFRPESRCAVVSRARIPFEPSHCRCHHRSKKKRETVNGGIQLNFQAGQMGVDVMKF